MKSARFVIDENCFLNVRGPKIVFMVTYTYFPISPSLQLLGPISHDTTDTIIEGLSSHVMTFPNQFVCFSFLHPYPIHE